MVNISEFNKEYGKPLFTFDSTYLSVLSGVLFFTFIIILFLAGRDYTSLNEKYKEQIIKRYVQTISTLYAFEKPAVTGTGTAETGSNFYIRQQSSTREQRQEIRNRIAEDVSRQGVLGLIKGNVDKYSDLPEVAFNDILDIGDIISEKQKIAENALAGGGSGSLITDSYDIELDYGLGFVTRKIHRKGQVYLDPPDEMIHDQSDEIRGFRDPEEITIVIQKKEALIHYCYQKVARNYSMLSGHVVVRFVILHSGRVDPSSVEIVESTLYNKKIENCIKMVLKRWRDFEELDASMGSVAVVQKFIFN